MTEAMDRHAEQIAFWNGPAGARWAEEQVRMDAVLEPVLNAALAQAAPRPGETVLDVGCGCGTSAMALAGAVGPGGHVLGLDVSAPMLGLARMRSTGIANVAWVLADAASHPFEPASVDLIFSRFGVMFFGDPAAAFANLRRALRPSGRLVFACWRTLAENPWMRVPLQAVAAHVPPMPRPGPEDPGPLSFADVDRTTRILAAGGFTTPRFTPLDLAMDLANGGGLDAAVRQAASIGPASRALQEQPDPVRAAATESIRAALAPFVDGGRVALPAAVWLVEAASA